MKGALALVASMPWREPVGVTVCTAYDVPPPLLSGLAPTMVAEVPSAYRDVSRRTRDTSPR
jgi:hypothetical protein